MPKLTDIQIRGESSSEKEKKEKKKKQSQKPNKIIPQIAIKIHRSWKENVCKIIRTI